VELRGLEPLTPTLPVWCATSCAIAPGACRNYTTAAEASKPGREAQAGCRAKVGVDRVGANATQSSSPEASGLTGGASVPFAFARSHVSGASTHPTAARNRITPLTLNAHPKDSS